MLLLKIIGHLLLAGTLTVVTQTGGVVYLGYLALRKGILPKVYKRGTSLVVRTGVFFALYLVINFLVLPPVVARLGRVPLPATPLAAGPLAPGSWWTVLCNRHYVRPPLRLALRRVAADLRKQHPDFRLFYLDAGFPFLDGFPLLPHLSHDDGRKVDLSFVYYDQDGNLANDVPTTLGYGYLSPPAVGEFDQPAVCARKGHWPYSLLPKLTVFPHDYRLAEGLTGELIERLSREPDIGKLLLEPHLKVRLGQGRNDKVRYHGCHAVRHDDHLHVQL